jgi:hypothetical protein
LTVLPAWFVWAVTSSNLQQIIWWVLAIILVGHGIWLWRGLSKRVSYFVKCGIDLSEGVLTIVALPEGRFSSNGIGSAGSLGLASQFKILPSSRVSPWALFLRLQVIDNKQQGSENANTGVNDLLLLSNSVSKKSYRALACSVFRSQQKLKVLK